MPPAQLADCAPSWMDCSASGSYHLGVAASGHHEGGGVIRSVRLSVAANGCLWLSLSACPGAG
eukprot:2995585-Lingulodinium_polyedra.AAC.1